MTYLLDVNVLLALTDPAHTQHEPAHQWFQENGHRDWASCPITENGFVRIASNPGYPNRPGDTQVVLQALRGLCQLPGHQFWPDSVSLRDVLSSGAALSHNQLTDLYLLALAGHNRGKLATFDQKIATSLVPNGQQHLEILGQ